MVAAALGAAVVRTLSRLAILGSARKIAFDVRNYFFAHLTRLSASFYDSHRTGDIMSRGVNDIQLLQSFFGFAVMNLLNASIVYTASLVLLFRIDVRLTLISLVLYPPLFFVVNRMSRRVYVRSRAVQEQLAAISNHAQENIAGIQQVKTYVQEDREIAAFGELCAEFRRRNLSMALLRGAMTSMIGIVAGTGSLIVLFLGGASVISGRITFGDFVAFNTYLGLLVWPTIALGWIINTFQRGAAAMVRLDEVLREDPDVPPALDDAEQPLDPVAGDIEIRGLSFHYPHDRADAAESVPALRDVHLSIPENSRVALVGPVGSGKSTLAALLARLYPVPRGTLFIGGTDINDIPVSRLRRSIGFVPQEAFLFSRSVRENVLFGGVDDDARDVDRAIRVSHLAGDLSAFPEGLDTLVGERGYTLSGGQRQRATLARAVVGDPRLLILDDSLSSVDADTERSILEELDRMMQGRTTIFISHRLSTLAGMDRIVVMDRGAVAEQGTHDELMASNGVYARLFRRNRLERDLEAR
ncbi:MAG: ABC transporter ATP-binding protein [bacterium]|nr:ABC transporter ATP-binding protein [bacterium]